MAALPFQGGIVFYDEEPGQYYPGSWMNANGNYDSVSLLRDSYQNTPVYSLLCSVQNSSTCTIGVPGSTINGTNSSRSGKPALKRHRPGPAGTGPRIFEPTLHIAF